MNSFNVWSCGGGVQSSAIASMICRGRLPKPDMTIMVDTEREKSNVWEYVRGVLIPNLAKVGVEIIIVPKSEYAKVDLYHDDDSTLPLIPAYTGDNGRVPTYCSSQWKQRVVHRYLAKWMPSDSCRTWLGISADELKRVRTSRYSWLHHCYPLVEAEFGLNYDRNDCNEEIKRAGWPPAPRSSCWMCPNQTSEEWAAVIPTDLAKARELEIELQKRDPNVYLHRSRLPIDKVNLVTYQNSDRASGCSGQCNT